MPVFSQEQYDALAAAISTGSKVVQYADKRVEYRSLSEMLGLLNLMAGDLGLTANVTNKGRRVAQFESGLYPSDQSACE